MAGSVWAFHHLLLIFRLTMQKASDDGAAGDREFVEVTAVAVDPGGCFEWS